MELLCPRTVVEMADSLIRYNHPASRTPRLQPLPGIGAGNVSAVQWRTVDDEAQGIALGIQALTTQRRNQHGDFLVLTPRRLMGYRIRNQLRALGVPVHSFYHEEALEADRAQESYSLLTLLAVPNDRVALRWWLGFGSSTWLAGSYARLRARSETTGRSPLELLQDLDTGASRIPGTAPLVVRYRDLRDRLLHLVGLPLPDLVDDLFPDGDDDFVALREIAVLTLASSGTVVSMHDAVRNHITQPEMPESGDFVRIMSLHKAKGLTAPFVIVAGCIEGLIPTLDSALAPAEQARSMNEQRRLFYVAITRCTTALVLSSAVRIDRALAMRVGATLRPGWADPAGTTASRFLAELGPSSPAPIQGQAWLGGL